MTVFEIVGEYAGAPFGLDTPFDDLKIDSLEFIQIIRQAEDAFNVVIPNDDIGSIKTVRDLVAEIEGLRHTN